MPSVTVSPEDTHGQGSPWCRGQEGSLVSWACMAVPMANMRSPWTPDEIHLWLYTRYLVLYVSKFTVSSFIHSTNIFLRAYYVLDR